MAPGESCCVICGRAGASNARSFCDACKRAWDLGVFKADGTTMDMVVWVALRVRRFALAAERERGRQRKRKERDR